MARNAGLGLTAHAGEADGPESCYSAIHGELCCWLWWFLPVPCCAVEVSCAAGPWWFLPVHCAVLWR